MFAERKRSRALSRRYHALMRYCSKRMRSVYITLTDATQNLISGELTMMKSSAVLINAGRGGRK
ncbi:hypothetical protein OH492_22600 [Vibrio chagasii]|nr:hypothetical protein [Vibrio chagasii]